MDGLGGHYAESNKSERERQMYDITYMRNLKKKYNKLVNIRKKETGVPIVAQQKRIQLGTMRLWV